MPSASWTAAPARASSAVPRMVTGSPTCSAGSKLMATSSSRCPARRREGGQAGVVVVGEGNAVHHAIEVSIAVPPLARLRQYLGEILPRALENDHRIGWIAVVHVVGMPERLT